jgi:small-conductance mechanosensitive channel
VTEDSSRMKMQGVDAFGDFAVQIRIKMMTLPGENFVIRREALAMIKMEFNAIKFAFPTAQSCRRRRTLHRRDRRCRTPRTRIDQARGGV